MNRLISTLLALVMAIGMVALTSTPASAACRTVSQSGSVTLDVDKDDERTHTVKFYRSVRVEICGGTRTIQRVFFSADPVNKGCEDINSFRVSPSAIAGQKHPSRTFACKAGGNSTTWEGDLIVRSHNTDRTSDFAVVVDRPGIDWNGRVLAYTIAG